ncbi:MAG: phytoene desaturase family protein [Methylacidiphilales bacterium]|nr:phytoene desaturase family protein [Candidatus Methylacidiphilales bacterium]MDW8348860.1 phytoene desaturase family protein [Verrucomicrobiae bacterium]
MSQRVLIIGAGIGGLATAIRLAHAGYTVEIWEKNQTPGGKAQEFRHLNFRWDIGPSLITMPHLLRDLFALCGRPLERYLDLIRLNQICRYFWSDGHQIDENAQFFKDPQVTKFLNYARALYELAEPTFLRHPPDRWIQRIQWHDFILLRHLPKICNLQTLAEKVNSFFQDPHLRQLFHRYATYNGSSPFRAPAAFNIIPYVEYRFGAWYPKGGVARIPQALAQLAKELGVSIHYGRHVARFQNGEIISYEGHRITPEIIVANTDVIQAHRTWLRPYTSKAQQMDIASKELSCSAYILLLAVEGQEERLEHHNIFFSDNYEQEFDEIFNQKCLPTDPTIYLSITARTDPQDAPPHHDNYFILINAPSTAALYSFPKTLDEYDAAIIDRLEHTFNITSLSKRIQFRHRITPLDISIRDSTYLGSLYGWASHSIITSLWRPPIQASNPRNLFFVGGTTHPGGGIPMVILSAQMVAERIMEQFPLDASES